jgi:Zinc carboxypeptidase
MPIPDRADAYDYHFHAYDYFNSVAKGPFGLSDGQPGYNGWRFYSLVRDLQGLCQEGVDRNVPNIEVTRPGGFTAEHRRTVMLSFGNNAPDAPTVMITGGIHAREWIAPEFVYLLAEYLIKNYYTVPTGRYQRAIRKLVNSRRIRIIPMLNPDGNLYTVFTDGARLWRKNRRPLPATAADWGNALQPAGHVNPPFQNVVVPGGAAALAQYEVPDYQPSLGIPPGPATYRNRTLENRQTGVDLNRNCATTAWGYECKPESPDEANYDPRSLQYFGPRASSEAETSNVQLAVAQAANPGLAAMLDYHSYGMMIVYPSETDHAGAVDPDYAALGRTLQALIKSDSGAGYRLGSSLDLMNYDATGTIIDHAVQQYHPRAFTIELDGAVTGDGFDLRPEQIQMVFEKNIRGALAVIAAADMPARARFTRQTISHVESQFLSWHVWGRGNQLPQP